MTTFSKYLRVVRTTLINHPVPIITAGLLLATGCMSSYRNVKDIHQLTPDRSAVISVVIDSNSKGRILQEEIEKDLWRMHSRSFPYPVLNYEWYLWLAIDKEVYPLIPKGRTFINNVSLIHEGDTVKMTREYSVPTGEHKYLLEFAGMRPYVYTVGSSSVSGGGVGVDDEDGGDYEGETRFGLIWKQCFTADTQPGDVITVRIDNEGIYLPEGVKKENVSECNKWILGSPVETFKENLP